MVCLVKEKLENSRYRPRLPKLLFPTRILYAHFGYLNNTLFTFALRFTRLCQKLATARKEIAEHSICTVCHPTLWFCGCSWQLYRWWHCGNVTQVTQSYSVSNEYWEWGEGSVPDSINPCWNTVFHLHRSCLWTLKAVVFQLNKYSGWWHRSMNPFLFFFFFLTTVWYYQTCNSLSVRPSDLNFKTKMPREENEHN